jgi:hypothetical protein
MASLMPSNSKELHLYRPSQSKPKRARKNAAPTVPPIPASAMTTTTAIGSSNGADIVMKDTTSNLTDPSDPNLVTPSTPSTYLSRPSQSAISATSFAITSVSRGKRKAASIVDSAAGSEISAKRSRPLSATAKAQVESSDAMKRLANALENMTQNFDSYDNPLPPSSVPGLQASSSATQPVHNDESYIEQATEVLMLFNLSPEQNNVIADYMGKPANRMKVIFFLKFDHLSREVWIHNVLNEIREREAKRAQAE